MNASDQLELSGDAIRPGKVRHRLSIRRKWSAPLDANAPVLGKIGSMEARLARTRSEIRVAQELRYQVFFEEMSASPDPVSRILRRDKDRHDRISDHLLVLDRDAAGKGRIVGTYRFLTAEQAAAARMPFYSQSEFQVDRLAASHPGRKFMELGRSCVLPQWRTKRTIELLWAGTWAHVLKHKVDVMIGCASFEGTDPAALCEPLSFLHHHAAPSPPWQVEAVAGRGISTAMIAKRELNPKRAMQALPSLIKGYLRLGAMFSTEAVVDHAFGTTDVLVILPVANIAQRYIAHYGADASRHAPD
ncbi:MAG: GNAT family N-acetyltransferase [Nitratireductor sp.]|nr:GNAT family N-acetyltransferase [Nitratireductor sp.]MCB1458313.1 GNAT family N-acetyltransferase [Nitratireductor sp.]